MPMNVLVVLAHPESQSVNGHLARSAAAAMTAAGHSVRVSDLYAEHFDPCEAGRHFRSSRDPARFDAQAEQRHAWDTQSLAGEIKQHVENVLWADLVILQFPLWWFGLPAILKGWVDRVFVYGGLYSSSRRHDKGVCGGKKVLFCVTTGSPAAACAYNGHEGETALLLWPSLYAFRYIGFSVLQPYIIHGVRGGLTGAAAAAQKQRLATEESAYIHALSGVQSRASVPFNRDEDWDEADTLKSGAPVYSPFIRHSRVLGLTGSPEGDATLI